MPSAVFSLRPTRRHSLLHPRVIKTVREVLASVSTARLLAGLSGHDRLVGARQQVAELERLNEVTVV